MLFGIAFFCLLMWNERPAEKLIILLLGARDAPIPSEIHLQKEMFLLSRSYSTIQDTYQFSSFYLGAFSRTLLELSHDPFYYREAFTKDQNGYHLTEEGRIRYRALVHDLEHNEKFGHVLSSMKLIRSIYDKFTGDELLCLMYLTYPEFTDSSSEFDRVVRNKKTRDSLLKNMLAKNLITKERLEELSAKE